MKLTKLRDSKTGAKLNDIQFEELIKAIEYGMQIKGFVSCVSQVNSTHLKIAGHGHHFKLDPLKHEYNAMYSPHRHTKLGYTRTHFPTWDQRVQFNDMLNDVLDVLQIECKVVSGFFLIRDGAKRYHENDWHDQKPEYCLSNEARGFVTESLPK